jgi:arylsulfatase A
VPVCSIDFFPTLLEVAGVALPDAVDGMSLVPLLKGTGSVRREALYWHYPHYWGGTTVRPSGTVRAGDWKLIEFYEDMRVELYNLKEDFGEARDLSRILPEKVTELRDQLHAWRAQVGAQMPVANENYLPGSEDGG